YIYRVFQRTQAKSLLRKLLITTKKGLWRFGPGAGAHLGKLLKSGIIKLLIIFRIQPLLRRAMTAQQRLVALSLHWAQCRRGRDALR
ncbi:unnamed protein product, partial [Ixodes hexagonus]